VPYLPDVPTLAEAGVKDFNTAPWQGVLAPAGTPAAVLGKLQSEIAAIVESPETQKRFQLEGADVLRMTAEQFGKHIAAETDKWTRVVKQAGIKAE
jgi:tripartite-type tricarboxylate transporter receptor subunit TctC